MTTALQEAAQAVLDRWYSPSWSWAQSSHTGDLMNALRRAIDAHPRVTQITWNAAGVRTVNGVPDYVARPEQPAEAFKKLSDEEVLWIAQGHGIDVYACNALAFYADLISTTPLPPADQFVDANKAIAPLTNIDALAKVYASSYASPHHITFTVEGLRAMIADHIKAEKD